jgi:hypothetical protein
MLVASFDAIHELRMTFHDLIADDNGLPAAALDEYKIISYV